MQKLLNYRIYIIIITIAMVLGITFIVRSYMYSKEIQALVTPLEMEQGTQIFFSDSTKGASQWRWEFGNGDTSSKQSGRYTFPKRGKYQIRLTVDKQLEKKFIVDVRSSSKDNAWKLIRIIAPETALQGEYITLTGEGSSKEWRWEFGETGKVDAIEKTAIYKYNQSGNYVISLRTEDTKYPIIHHIEIIPQYSDTDTTDVASIIGSDIQEKLQNIVDQKPFNSNYNYIMDKYICNDPNTLVIINNTQKNDFYSYCQGLKIIGKNKTIIDKVLIDVGESDACVSKLIVIQTDLE